MSRFITSLHVRQVSDGEWVLLAPLIYASDLIGTVTVPEGFVTDFASVPRLPLAYVVAGGKATKEAVIHDWLYRTASVQRSTADAVFREAMEANGQAWWRRNAMWAAVRMFGWTSFPDNSLQGEDDDEIRDHSPGA